MEASDAPKLNVATWPDYDLDNRSTWEPMEAPSVDSSWTAALTRIGGTNPFGKPNLVWRWGASYEDPMSVDNILKYWLTNKEPTLQGFEFTDPVTNMLLFVETLDEVPPTVLISIPKYNKSVQLGQRRIIIEQWRSPSFLAAGGRYTPTMIRDGDTVHEFFFCKACDAELFCDDQGPWPCAKCGSKRSYLRAEREAGEGVLLRSFPRDGAYDCFLILETPEGLPAAPDGNALAIVEMIWHKLQTQSKRDQMKELLVETPQDILQRTATSPINPFAPPPVPGA